MQLDAVLCKLHLIALFYTIPKQHWNERKCVCKKIFFAGWIIIRTFAVEFKYIKICRDRNY